MLVTLFRHVPEALLVRDVVVAKLNRICNSDSAQRGELVNHLDTPCVGACDDAPCILGWPVSSEDEVLIVLHEQQHTDSALFYPLFQPVEKCAGGRCCVDVDFAIEDL